MTRRPVYIVARIGDPRHSWSVGADPGGESQRLPCPQHTGKLPAAIEVETSTIPDRSPRPLVRKRARGGSGRGRPLPLRRPGVVGLQPPDVPGSLPMGVAARVDDQCRSALHRLGQRVVAAVTDHDVRGRVNGPEIAPLLRQPHATGGVHRPGGRDRLPGCGRPAHQIELDVAEFSKRAACNPESGPGRRSPNRPSTRSSGPAGPGRVAGGPPRRSWRAKPGGIHTRCSDPRALRSLEGRGPRRREPSADRRRSAPGRTVSSRPRPPGHARRGRLSFPGAGRSTRIFQARDCPRISGCRPAPPPANDRSR